MIAVIRCQTVFCDAPGSDHEGEARPTGMHGWFEREIGCIIGAVTCRSIESVLWQEEFVSDYRPPVRAITAGPLFHWFGYYDKLEFDPTGRYVLGMEVGFEHRSPVADDEIVVGMVDLEDDRWLSLGTSRAWCWQQGCMLQWRPGSEDEVVWNDRRGDHFVCHVLNVRTGHRRTLPHPIYALSPDGRTAIGTDFRRINDMRPGYGYAGLADPNANVLAPDDVGVYRMDVETGESELIVTIAQVAAIPWPYGDLSAAKHYFNHLLFNPDGSRFVFLHRWRMPGGRVFRTRMVTAAADGSDLRIVDDNGLTSHFIWRDPNHILAWSRQPACGEAFYLFRDLDGCARMGCVEAVGAGIMTRDGHCSYLPGGEWIVNDVYPDADRYQTLYLYHVESGRVVTLGRFYSPPPYTGEWRCDLHPRCSRDGRYIAVDSAHGGGRQIYLVDIGDIVHG